MSEETKPIYILGDTPLAYFLTAKLSLAGENVCLLGDIKGFRESNSILLKDTTTSQKSTVSIQVQTVMHEPARMVLLCLSPEKIKSGLVYFSRAKTENCPILSFCHTANDSLIAKIINQPIFPAYFDGWLKAGIDNSLTYLGAPQGITVGISSRHHHYTLVQETLDKTDIPTDFSSNKLQTFWNYFISYAACSFFSIQNGPHLREIAKKTLYRQNLNTILDELLILIPDNIEISKEQIINSIYSTPLNYKYPVLEGELKQKRAELAYLSDIIHMQSMYNTLKLPTISQLISLQMQKLLSSVEE